MATARHLLLGAMLFASGAASCILLVSPPSGTGAHCGFRGAETACGACLKERCQAPIDAICLDDPAGVLPVLEQCAATGDEACGRLPPSDVATCTTASCAAYCSPRTGTSATRCEESFFAPALACSCQTSGLATDLDCSKRTFPRARCCAPPGWPGAGLRCACDAVACVSSTAGCICTLTDNLDTNTAAECTGTHCCALQDRCECRPRACSGAEREVLACNTAALRCPPNTTEVESCSIRR
jgi:hypothetical protein